MPTISSFIGVASCSPQEEGAHDRYDEEQLQEFIASRPSPKDEEMLETQEKEVEFRRWCAQNSEDPEDEGVLDRYNEEQAEINEFWTDLNEDDGPGWEDNMNKD